MRATPDALDALHGLLSETLAAELKAAKEAEGPIPAALLNAVIKFLKDNGIDAPASSRRFDPLVEQLRDLEFDEDRPH